MEQEQKKENREEALKYKKNSDIRQKSERKFTLLCCYAYDKKYLIDIFSCKFTITKET